MQIPWDALIKPATYDFASGYWSQYLAVPFPAVPPLTRLHCPVQWAFLVLLRLGQTAALGRHSIFATGWLRFSRKIWQLGDWENKIPALTSAFFNKEFLWGTTRIFKTRSLQHTCYFSTAHISTMLQTLVKKRLLEFVLPGDCRNCLLLSSRAAETSPEPLGLLWHVHAEHSTGLKDYLLLTFYENIKWHGFVLKWKTTSNL